MALQLGIAGSLVASGVYIVVTGIEKLDGLRYEINQYRILTDDQERDACFNRAVTTVKERYPKYMAVTGIKMVIHGTIVHACAPTVFSMVEYVLYKLKFIHDKLHDPGIVTISQNAFLEIKTFLENVAVKLGMSLDQFAGAVGATLLQFLPQLLTLGHWLCEQLKRVCVHVCNVISHEFLIYCVELVGIFQGVFAALQTEVNALANALGLARFVAA